MGHQLRIRQSSNGALPELHHPLHWPVVLWKSLVKGPNQTHTQPITTVVICEQLGSVPLIMDIICCSPVVRLITLTHSNSPVR